MAKKQRKAIKLFRRQKKFILLFLLLILISTYLVSKKINLFPLRQTLVVPEGWKAQKSSYCNVKFAIPPANEPYSEYLGTYSKGVTPLPEEKRYWQIREGKNNPNEIFTASTAIMYVANIESSGAIAGATFIECGPNLYTYTTDELVRKYVEEVNKTIKPENYLYKAEYNADKISIKSETKENIWGQHVLVVQLTGGMMLNNIKFYFLTTKDHVYKIEKRVDSPKQVVKDITDEIFNSLQFIN